MPKPARKLPLEINHRWKRKRAKEEEEERRWEELALMKKEKEKEKSIKVAPIVTEAADITLEKSSPCEVTIDDVAPVEINITREGDVEETAKVNMTASALRRKRRKKQKSLRNHDSLCN